MAHERELADLSPERQAVIESRPPLPALGTLPAGPLPEGYEDDAVDLRRAWEILRRRKWTVITFFSLVVIAVMTATFLMTPIYRATLVLQIEREDIEVVEYKDVIPAEHPTDQENFYHTQYELLKSRSLVQRVIDQLHLADDPKFLKAAMPGGKIRFLADWLPAADPHSHLVDIFLRNLTVEPVRNSRLVKICYDSPDPELAARIVNALADAFININLERRFGASSYARNFLEERLQQIKAKLEDSERELVEFARRKGIINLSEDAHERQTVLSKNLEETSSALTKAIQDRIKAEAAYMQMSGGSGPGHTRVLDDKVIQSLREAKAKLEAEYQEGLSTFKPDYPMMVERQGRLKELQARIDQEVASVRAAVKSEYEAAKSNENLLTAKFRELKGEVQSLQTHSIQYNILKREADTSRQLYDGLLQRYKEVGIAGGVSMNNILVVDKGEVPEKPNKPDLRLNALMAIFSGGFLGIAVAFLFEYLDDALKGPEDVERRLGLPVIGIIPRVKDSGDGKNLGLLSHLDPKSAFSEAYRSARTTLQFATSEGMPRVLLVTSAEQSEGKTTTAVSLAINIAQTGRSVLLIDADLRKPSLHRVLALENSRGLSHYLVGNAGPADITVGTMVPGLFLIPSGPLPPNPAELLCSTNMASLLSLASEKFDHIVLDGPPMLGLADAVVLGHFADGVVVVAEAGATRHSHVAGAVKRLANGRARVLGVILTKLDARGSGYGYYHSYYYYQYGSEEKELPAPRSS